MNSSTEKGKTFLIETGGKSKGWRKSKGSSKFHSQHITGEDKKNILSNFPQPSENKWNDYGPSMGKEKGCKTIGNHKCMFPFIYDGEEYTGCISVENDGKPWCATAIYKNGTIDCWDDCGDSCIRDTKDCWTADDHRCVFPFIYDGEEYTGCTSVENDGKLWCATDIYKNGKMQEWDDCGDSCISDNKVDGNWGPWGSWSSIYTMKKKRRRKCNNPAPLNGGAQCQGPSSDETTSSGVCDEPKGVVGKCRHRQRITKWTFDKPSLACLPYFACNDGQGNKFNSKAECEKSCVPGSSKENKGGPAWEYEKRF